MNFLEKVLSLPPWLLGGLIGMAFKLVPFIAYLLLLIFRCHVLQGGVARDTLGGMYSTDPCVWPFVLALLPFAAGVSLYYFAIGAVIGFFIGRYRKRKGSTMAGRQNYS